MIRLLGLLIFLAAGAAALAADRADVGAAVLVGGFIAFLLACHIFPAR